MTVAGFDIIACPSCRELYKQPIIMSYNTFFASYYSDGYMDGAGIPNFTPVIKCRNCAKFFKRQDAEKIGEMLYDEGLDSYPAEWQNAIDIDSCQLTAEELEEALQTDLCENRENELTMRTLLLERYNDVYRNTMSRSNYQLQRPEFINNIKRLLEITERDDKPEGQLMMAELHREVGEFDACLKILDGLDAGEKRNIREMKEKIYSQAKIGDAGVINFSITAIKKEFRCNKCSHSLILFDLNKLITLSKYKYFRCITENIVFNAPTMEKNPEPAFYESPLKRIFVFWKTYREYIPVKQISCSQCGGTHVESFRPMQKCLQCGKGKYKPVQWFN